MSSAPLDFVPTVAGGSGREGVVGNSKMHVLGLAGALSSKKKLIR